MRYHAVVAATVALVAAPAFGGDMPWAKNWAAASKLADKNNKLVMIDFYTEW